MICLVSVINNRCYWHCCCEDGNCAPGRVSQVSRRIVNDLRNGARGMGIATVFPSDEEEFASTDNIAETENSDKIDRAGHG